MPIELASGFATIVSLLISFKNERQGSHQATFQDFRNWLEENSQTEILREVEGDLNLQEGVKGLLRESHQEVMKKLEGLDTTLAAVSRHLSGFEHISIATHPETILSDQAVSIMRDLYESGGEFLIESQSINADNRLIIAGNRNSSEVTVKEPRFLEDDLSNLVKYGFLRLDFAPKGERTFYITRQAARYIKSVDGE